MSLVLGYKVVICTAWSNTVSYRMIQSITTFKYRCQGPLLLHETQGEKQEPLNY